jgi:hypothetical protein
MAPAADASPAGETAPMAPQRQRQMHHQQERQRQQQIHRQQGRQHRWRQQQMHRQQWRQHRWRQHSILGGVCVASICFGGLALFFPPPKSGVLIPRIKTQAQWTHWLGWRGFPSVSLTGFSDSNGRFAVCFPPRRFEITFVKVLTGKKNAGGDANRMWSSRLGQGGSSSVFSRAPGFIEPPRGTAGCLKQKSACFRPHIACRRATKRPTH